MKIRLDCFRGSIIIRCFNGVSKLEVFILTLISLEILYSQLKEQFCSSLEDIWVLFHILFQVKVQSFFRLRSEGDWWGLNAIYWEDKAPLPIDIHKVLHVASESFQGQDGSLSGPIRSSFPNFGNNPFNRLFDVGWVSWLFIQPGYDSNRGSFNFQVCSSGRSHWSSSICHIPFALLELCHNISILLGWRVLIQLVKSRGKETYLVGICLVFIDGLISLLLQLFNLFIKAFSFSTWYQSPHNIGVVDFFWCVAKGIQSLST